jgi:hypothetical protein
MPPADGAGPRFAYVVMSHSAPRQLARLVGTIRTLSPQAAVVVHHDAARSPLDAGTAAAFAADDSVHVLTSAAPLEWGGISVVSALLRCFRWVDEHLGADWVVHLSGLDYPLRPLAELEDRLRSGGFDAYLRAARVGTQDEVGGRLRQEDVRRYFFQYHKLPGWIASRLGGGASGAQPGPVPTAPGAARAGQPGSGARLRRLLRAVPAPIYVKRSPRGDGAWLGIRARRTPFRDGYACYKGSLWVMLSRPALRRLLDTLDARPELLRYWARTTVPDESVVPTVLANDPTVRLCTDPLRFIAWTPGSPHPDVLTAGRLDELRDSGAFLARKFDMQADASILDALDAALGLPRPA